MASSSRTRGKLKQLMAALDYRALGQIYCEDGGDAFWADRRPAVVDLGLCWAAELAKRLPRGGRSLYVGAGVAELPVLLTELLDLERTCVVTNLRAEECASINASLAAVELSGRLFLEPVDAATVVDRGPFDHVSLVSVFDDPETFPQVSDVTYGRASPTKLDPKAFGRERRRIRELAAVVVGALTLPAVVTTTFEEVQWVVEAAERAGLGLRADETVVNTALVGDPVGFLAIEAPA